MNEINTTPSGGSAADKAGVVVLGLPRSGTTLLRRLLNAHPSIACGGETFLLRATAQFIDSDTIVDGIDYGVMGGLQAAGFSGPEILSRLRSLAFSFLRDFAIKQDKTRWATKTAVDSFYVNALERIYGDHVKFICVVRHGLDATLSLADLCEANEIFIKELHRYIVRHPRQSEAFAHAWRDVTTDLLELTVRRPSTSLLCRYEDLVTLPEETITKILTFLGEDFDDGLIARAMSVEQVEGLGDWKTFRRSTIDDESVGRWKSLRPDIVSRLGEIVNPCLARCGYDIVPINPLPRHDEAMHRYEMSMKFEAARSAALDSDD